MTPRNRSEALFNRLTQLLKRIPLKPRPEAVHQLRTTVRRIETLMKAAPSGAPQEQKLLKQLARIRKRAGKVRDVDVQMTALRTVKFDSTTRDKARVMRALEDNRRKQERKLGGIVEEAAEDGVQRRIRVVNSALLSQVEAGTARRRVTRDCVGEALRKFGSLVQSHPALTDGNLHNFRMACKRIRYLAEMAGETPQAQTVVTQLKRIQDAIGAWHDWLTLTEIAEGVLADSPRSPLLAVLRAQKHAGSRWAVS